MDLSKLSISDLKALQVQIVDELKGREKQEINKAREQIMAIANSVGIPVKDLLASLGGKAPKATTKVAPQYVNPADASQTWTGRGRQPKFIADLIASGKKLEDLKIKS